MTKQHTILNNLTKLVTWEKTARALGIALGTVLPWIIGSLCNQSQNGSIISFGSYLLVSTFIFLPKDHTFKILCLSAIIFSLFATVGIFTTLGSPFFFIFAIFAAATQCISELRNNHLRMPFALATLGYFLSINQIPEDGPFFYALFFSMGCIWGIFITYFGFTKETKPLHKNKIDLKNNPEQQRFTISIAITTLLGSIIACFSPGTHPCWLPAAALRVIKPTQEQTIYRIKTRITGSLLGAAAGGILLGLSPIPWLHILLVCLVMFIMQIATAKRYGIWTFCLTSVALAFNFPATGDIFLMATDRVLLTAGGILIALAVLLILPNEPKTKEDSTSYPL